MFIQNISFADVTRLNFNYVGNNAMLIQIVDPDFDFPKPSYDFKEIHQFNFLDTHKGDDEHSITNEQAEKLVHLLQTALQKEMNVIVHCIAGICRSGAVCEVGVMMGFDDTGHFRNPNLLVKSKMIKVLDWGYE